MLICSSGSDQVLFIENESFRYKIVKQELVKQKVTLSCYHLKAGANFFLVKHVFCRESNIDLYLSA